MDACMGTGDNAGVSSANPKHTPARSIRVPGRLWDPAKRKAAQEGETVTDVVVRALERYVAEPTPATTD